MSFNLLMYQLFSFINLGGAALAIGLSAWYLGKISDITTRRERVLTILLITACFYSFLGQLYTLSQGDPKIYWTLKLSGFFIWITTIYFSKTLHTIKSPLNNKTMPKPVAGFNETVNDILEYVAIDGTSDTLTINLAVSALPTTPSAGHPAFQANDANGVTDGCCMIPSDKTATFHYKRPNNDTYIVSSQEFISGGSHPPTRPI